MEAASFIAKITNLPSPSPVLRRITAVLANPETPVPQVVEALKLDPAVAGKVLRLANSAYIGMPRKISSLQNAVVLLGLKRVQSLILVSRFIEPFGKKNPSAFSLEKFWRHSTSLALIAESIGRHLKRYDSVDEQELFSAAILHDIGKLALAVFEPDKLQEALARSSREKVPFFQAEQEPWSHTVVGAHLAEHWGFPAELSAAIAGHHLPLRFNQYARFVSIIHVADFMVHVIGYSTYDEEVVPQLDEKALDIVRLPPERLKIIAETEIENQRKIEDLCDIFRD